MAAGYRSVETCRWKFAVIVLVRETQKRAGLQRIPIYSDPCLELSEVESMLKEEMSKPKQLYEGCICCNLEQQMKVIAECCTRHSEKYLTKVSGLRSANLRHLSGSAMVERLTTYSMSLCDIHIRYSIVQFYCRFVRAYICTCSLIVSRQKEPGTARNSGSHQNSIPQKHSNTATLKFHAGPV